MSGHHGVGRGVLPSAQARRIHRLAAVASGARTFHIGGMLSIVVMAAMSGANSVKAIARFAQKLDMPQRRELCMPYAKSRAGVVAKHEYKVPSYVTIYNFLKTLRRRLLSETDLTNALVCSDALHCQHDTVRTVAASNGESLGDCFQLLLRVAYGFRNIDTMIGLIMLFCSPIKIPWPGRKQNEPINKLGG